jgi:hypothetical protein
VLSEFLGLSGEIVQVSENDLSQIMKNVCHGMLKSGSGLLEAKRNDMICKSTARGSECSFVLISWVDLNLVVARETVHEGKRFMSSTIIDNLVNKGHWKIVFGISMIEIMKIRTDTNSSLCFVNGDGVGDP